jgi:hypothetical protein
MASTSTTERSLKYYTDKGYLCDMVEKWVKAPRHPAGGFRRDFLNIIDFIALKPGATVGVQSCGTDYAQHITKLQEYEDNLKLWLQANNRFELIGWRQVKKVRGKDAKIWKPRVTIYCLENNKIKYEEVT